ncbi:unnamed protein product [Rotaria sordida]|uniref:TIR domain-containing protein n=1 Tax=Rotaria sordida TaxID=392033 RepID=A0A814Q7Z3_9BILA|nr:unnamed protein product [Rotaria sordida]
MDEQNEPFLQSNISTRPNRSISFVERLRRFLQQLLIFIVHYLFQIYEFLSKNNSRDTSSSYRTSIIETSTIAYSTIPIDIIDETEETTGQEIGEISVEAFENYLQSDEIINQSTLKRAGIAGILTLEDESVLSLSSTNELASPSPEPVFSTSYSSSFSQNPVNVALSYHDEITTRVQIISELLQQRITTSNISNLIFDVPTVHANMSVLDRRKTSKDVYKRAALVVVFLSPTYHNCNLCYNDWRAITNRFMVGCKDQQCEKLLLVKLGEYNADALGLFADDYHLDAMDRSDEDVANIIVDRWRMIENLLI